MACKITRKNDRIFEVKTPTNERSLLFDAIAKIPHVRNTEDALEIYKQVYTKDVKDNFEEWSKIVQNPEMFMEREQVTSVNISSAIDEYGEIDYEAAEDVDKIAKDRDIGITRDREIQDIARDENGNVIGGSYTSYDGEKYTFDVVVSKEAEGKGVGSQLLKRVMNLPYEIEEMNPDVTVEVDVVNPNMKTMLEKRGFEVIEKIAPERWLMRPTERTTQNEVEEKEVTFIDDNDVETTFKLSDIEVDPNPIEEEDGLKIFTYKAKGVNLGSVTVGEVIDNPNALRVNYSNLYGGKRTKEDINSIFEASLAKKILDRILKVLGTTFGTFNVNIGQGIGEAAYIKLGEQLSREGITLQSDTKRSKAAEKLWSKLEKKGLAKKVKNDLGAEINLEDPLTYLYEFTPEVKAESVVEDIVTPEASFNTLKTGEPKLFYMTSDGKVSNTLKGALSQNSTTNGTIKIGLLKGDNVAEVTSEAAFNIDNSGVVVFDDNVKVNDVDNFITLVEVDGGTNEATVTGFVNSQINRGLISDQMHFHNGEVSIQGAGENTSTQRYNTQVALAEFTTHPKMSTVRLQNEVLITFTEEGNLENEDGTKVSSEEFDKNPEKYKKNENLRGMLSTRANKSGISAFSKDVLQGETLTESEDELISSLLDFLNDMGIKQTTIDNYVENYKTKFGKEPSIKGLADLANQVIAFKDGVATKETFVEEVSHFLVEAFNDEGMIMDALLEVAGTEEYRQAKAQYESLYKDKYTDATDVEEAIRREALGKILAKSLMSNFSTENVSQAEASVMASLLDYLNTFIAKIKEFFNPQMESRIDQLNSKIQTHILNRNLEIFNADNLATSKFVLYDAGNASANSNLILNRLAKLKEGIERVFNVNEGDIEKVNQDSDEISKWGAITNTVGIMEKEVTYLNNQVEAVIQQGDRPTIEMMNSYASMKNVLMPILKEIDSYITRDGKPEFLSDRDFDNIKQSLADSMLEFSRVEGQWERIFSEEVFSDLVIDEIAKTHNWSDEFKEQYRKAINAEHKDVNVLMQSIGTVAHRGNPLLSLMQKQVSIINTRSDMNFLSDSKGTIKEIYDKGLDKYLKELQVRSEDGYATDRLLAPLRELEAERAYKDFLLETKAEIKEYEYVDIDDLRKLEKNHFTLNRQEVAKLEIAKTRWKLENLEQPFKEDYYREQLEWADRDPHIGLGLTALKNYNRELYSIKAKYKDANGRFDMSLLEQNKPDFEKYTEIQQSKKKDKLPYDSEFNLKKGIILNEEGRPIPDPNVNPETLSDDELTTWGMLKVEEYYREKSDGVTGEVSKEFMVKVLELEEEGGNAAYKFALANGGLNLNKAYWDSLSGDETYLQQMEAIISTLPEADKDIYEGYLEDYIKLTRHKQSLNKINRDLKQPLELNYSNSSADKKAILEIDEALEDLRAKLPRVEGRQIADSEVTLNQSYHRDLKNESIKVGSEEELRFLEANSTRPAKIRLGGFETRLKRHINSGAEILERDLQYTEGLDLSTPEGYLQARLNYAKQNVASYYKRFTPNGYDSFINDMENGTIKPSILFNKEANLEKYEGILNYIDFNPGFDWRLNENNEDIVNENYDPEGMNWQLKKDKWADDSFFEEFGINKADYLNGTRYEDLTATKNTEKFEALRLLTDWREKSLKRKGDSKFVSKFRLPRISKTSLEKAESIVKGGFPALKESLREMTSFRVDDLELGAEVDGTPLFGFYDLKAVPKFFETELENASDQSEDIIGMMALDNQQANLYEQRSDMEAKMLLSLNQLYSSNIGGKNAKESRAAKMAEEFINANLYGIQHNFDFSFTVMGKKINGAKILSTTNNWIRNLNLKYNPLVDITGATTAGLSRLALNNTEEFYSKLSSKKARKQVARMLPKLLQESGKVSKNSELQNLLEFFGDQDLTDRTQNSNYNRITRLAVKSGYGLSKVSNLTNSPQILLTILNDTKYVDGKFLNYVEFSNLPENNVDGIKDSEIREKWEKYNGKSLMDVLDYSKPNVSFTEEFANTVENPKQLLEDTVIKSTDRFSHLKELTDGVLSRENQVYAQRNPLLKFLLQHKGWLVINTDRKFKKRQWSTINNQEEIGQYTLIMELISDSIKTYFGAKNKGEDHKSWSQIYKEATEALPRNQRKALKGVKVDSMIVAALTVMGVGVLAFAEDDDNKDLWAAQLAALVYFRTLSERTSIGALGIKQTIMDNISSPVVGARTLDELTSLDGYSFEEVKSGKYKGHSKLVRKISKLTMGRRYFDLHDLGETSKAYRFYNANSLNGLGQGGFIHDWIKGK